jgi:hypothetical protein
LPEFVKDEFEAYLECGILAHGFLRVRCAGCAHEKLVAFSCKRRGFCPSCGARRMAESAAHFGVYRRTGGEPAFQAVRAPTRAELEGLLDKIIVRLIKMLTRQSHLVEEAGVSYLADIDAG